MSFKKVMVSFVLAVFAFNLVASVSTTAQAALDTIVFVDPLDANANDSDLDGVWDELSPGPLVNLLAYTGGSNYYYRAGLEFDVQQLTSQNAVVDNATLRVGYAGASGTPALTLQFYSFEGDGALTLDDFQTGASTPVGPRYNSFGPGTPDLYYEVPVTDFIQSLVDSGATHAGFMAENLANIQTRLGGYYSIRPPQLVVDYTLIPEPASAALVSLGFLALICQRRIVRV